MLKDKLGEVQKQLRGASYHTLLAVHAFIEDKKDKEDKALPRCVKNYGGASNRAVPMKVVIGALAAMTKWEAYIHIYIYMYMHIYIYIYMYI